MCTIQRVTDGSEARGNNGSAWRGLSGIAGQGPPQAQVQGRTSTPAKAALDDPVEEHEFPVFVYLLRFISNQGQIGDYARTALLHCLEVTARAAAAQP